MQIVLRFVSRTEFDLSVVEMGQVGYPDSMSYSLFIFLH